MTNREKLQSIDLIRCKDCIHAPLPGEVNGGFKLEWPKISGVYEDCACPYYCDDGWYSIRPDPNSFCDKGEAKND